MRVELKRRIPRWAVPLTQPKRYKGASGGRGSGKSHFFAEEAVERMARNPSARVVCIREIQKSTKFSVKALVESKIETLGVSALFEVQEKVIKRRGGTGLMIFEGMQDHTAESIKSLEGFDVAWVEEAQSISQKSLDMLLPTIRADGSEVWFSWNPRNKSDPVDVMFSKETAGAIRIHTTYLDNPFISRTLLDEARRAEIEDPDSFPHIWLGKYAIGGKGRVYSKFLEKPFPHGNIDDSVRDYGGEIYIGQDFNVNPMASIIASKVSDECHIFDEILLETSNTEEVCQEVQARYPNRHVVFCPDPAGNARHTNAKAGVTDFTIIRSFGFEVRAPSAHPAIVDRVNNANMMLCDRDGRRRVRVHSRCGHLIEAMNAHLFKPGTNIPDKKGGYDHANDAKDYLLWQEFNILTPPQVWGSSTFKAGFAKR
jgi:hypothetical protein